jgi:anti-sigma B factor antagonist
LQQPGLTVTYASGPETVVTVAGELDVATAPTLRQAFLDLLSDGTPDIAIDVSGVTFVDSSGLAVLLMGARRWSGEQKRFVLRTPSPMLNRLLDLAGVRRAFEVED